MIRAALAVIAIASRLAPRRLRAAWREEWVAETDAVARTRGGGAALRFAMSAPIDAASLRWTTQRRPGARWQGPWRTDLLQTLRALRRSPGHVAVVALCLGVGIAVCTTTFSILNAFTAGELPGVAERALIGRLHLSAGVDGPPDFEDSSVADYDILREESPSFSLMAAEGRPLTFAVRAPGRDAMNVDGAFVSGTYFDVLGTRPHLGRLLQPFDDRSDAPLAVVISHAFWTARLGAPAGIVGSTIIVGGRDAFVAGIAPERFFGLRGGEMNEESGLKLYLPLSHARGWPGAPGPEERWLNVYGRMTAPLDRNRLSAEVQPLAGRIEASDPVERRNARIAVTESWLTPDATTAHLLFLYALLLSAPLTVLAIGCANVANLQLVRASLRARELAVRISLGASRGQIIRLLTFEALFLVVAAGATAALGIWVLLRVAALVIPIPVHLDGRVMLFTAVIGGLVTVATGLVPGLLSTRTAAAAGLRSGGRSIASGNSRVRRGLVVAQVTLCFLLLLAAAVFTRGLSVIAGQVPAHAPDTLVTEVRFDVGDFETAERRAFMDAFDARVRADGRVRAIGYTSRPPFSNGNIRVWRTADAAEAEQYTGAVSVAGDFFDNFGVRILRGRALTAVDAAATTSVVVDENFVRRFELAEPVVGQSLRIALSRQEESAPRHVTIVGVSSKALAPGLGVSDPATIYLPLTTPLDYVAAWITADDAGRLTESVRSTIAEIDPELPPLAVRTLENHYAVENDPLRLIAQTAGGLGAVALLLAVSGLYSVIAFFVALRTNEFGIRMALGARAADIVRMVLGQALRLVGVGLALGALIGAPMLMALHASFPFNEPFDPVVVLPTALLIAATALVGGWVPARRASSIQASDALRAD
ncbi:MAG: ABC transporter permease [Acidobacteriota bacterium]|nr:ABC transporter permease [Acidobacteriota bacterium]